MGHSHARLGGMQDAPRVEVDTSGPDHLLGQLPIAVGVGKPGDAVGAQAAREYEQYLLTRPVIAVTALPRRGHDAPARLLRGLERR